MKTKTHLKALLATQRLARITGFICLSSMVAACVGEVDPETPGTTPSPIATSTPGSGVTPTPVIISTPTPTPTPVIIPTPAPANAIADYRAGKVVYNANCVSCHGVLEDSEKRNRDESAIRASVIGVRAMRGIILSDEEYRVLTYALTHPDPEENVELADGKTLYTDLGCTACHGNDGLQESQPIVFENYSFEAFVAKIDATMPPLAPSSCVGECAERVAQYIWDLRPQVSCDVENVLPRRIRQLTKFEYINSINDLFTRTDGEALASKIGSDTEVNNFDNNADANRISSIRMDSYWNAAEQIAMTSNLNPWLNTQNCSQNNLSYCFAEKFGRSAFRRDLSNEEKTQYQSLFNEGENDAEGARIVVQSMLVSPNFLYRTELGNGGQLTQYEIASLLSFTFWGSMPDVTLLNKAQNNALSNTTQLRQEVERLTADEKARKQFVHFGRQWLDLESVQDLDRDSSQFPSFTNNVAMAMDAEVELFLAELMTTDGYNLGDLFQSDFVFANQALAEFYDLDPINGSAMQKVESNGVRGGVLSLGALLARNAKFDDSHPIRRGLVVRQNLLCQEFGTPPAVIGEVEPFDPNKPTRERFAAHTANEACSSCHQYIDEIGFAFENYDAIGKYRSTEGNNLTVDATGSISGLERLTDSDTHDFSNLQDLSWILATEGLAPASECFVETFQRMMQGVAEPDSCTTDNIVSRWDSGSIKDLWIEIIASQSFSQRQ